MKFPEDSRSECGLRHERFKERCRHFKIPSPINYNHPSSVFLLASLDT